MAVSKPAVTEKPVRLPDASQPFGYVDGDRDKPVYIDPVWYRALLALADRDAVIADLVNAVRAEVNAQHP